MRVKRRWLWLLGALLLPGMLAAQEVDVLGLFKGAALIRIDGEQKLLKPGDEFAGLRLLTADSDEAVVEINGERHTLGLATHISGSYSQADTREVRIPRNAALQYVTTATINGRRLRVLVDTGANMIAMNAATAASLGLDYRAGQPIQLTTASGVVPGWLVRLDSVDVGGIRVDYLEASVVEGAQPSMLLLGTNYLRHVGMREESGVLLLYREY